MFNVAECCVNMPTIHPSSFSPLIDHRSLYSDYHPQTNMKMLKITPTQLLQRLNTKVHVTTRNHLN